MFLGHYALALGAKKAVPAVSLGTLILAAQFADLLWPTLLLLGLETVAIEPGNTVVTPLNFISYPYSHSLLMLLAWSALFALAHWLLRGKRPMAIATVAALVFSHYLLDVHTHRPDMPITIGGATRLGLGLWNHPGATLAIESGLFIIGAALYTSATRPRNRTGEVVFWFLIVILVAIYFSALYGPPPPNPEAVAVAGHLLWLFVLWGYWVDRNRQPR